MKILACILIAAGCITTHAQSLLNAGDIYTYEFTSSHATPSGGGGTGFSFTPTFSGFGAGDNILLEAFEDNMSEAPWGSVQYALDPAHDHLGTATHWIGDFQGVIRISALSGSVTLNSFRIQGAGFGPVGPQTYDLTVVPVPEPQTWCLLGMGGLMWIGFRRKLKA